MGCDKPVVAAVTGAAIGIGTTMLLHCDFVYVSDEARLAMPFVSLGLVPEFASSLIVPQLMGNARAAEKLLLGDPFTGADAVECGIANAVLPAGEVVHHARRVAERFNALPPGAVRETKRLLRRGRSARAARDDRGREPRRSASACRARRPRRRSVPSSRSASPTSRASDDVVRVAHPAAALALKLALAPLLVAQAIATRRRAPVLPEAAGAREGVLGDDGSPPLRVLVAGDSSAAGVGVAEQEQGVIGHFVRSLHRATGRPIAWALRARTGLTTRGVHELLVGAAPFDADIAVVVSGVNDVIDQVTTRRAVRDRAALADWLLGPGGVRHVVFAPLPPMHRFPLLPEPLRRIMGGDALRHGAALARWAATRGDVSHAAFVVELDAAVMASDGFHPGEPVYRACGEALAAHVARLSGPTS